MSIEIVTLPQEVTLRDVAEWHGRLCAALECGQPLRIDGSALTHADITLFQMLAAARASAARHGIELTISLPAQGRIADLRRLSGLVL